VKDACEKAIFASPQTTAAAVSYIAAELSLLASATLFSLAVPAIARAERGRRRNFSRRSGSPPEHSGDFQSPPATTLWKAREVEGKGKESLASLAQDTRARDGDVRARVKGEPIPDDWRPTKDDNAAAVLEGLFPSDLEGECCKFIDHARAHGRVSPDWSAACRNWCRDSARRRNLKPRTKVEVAGKVDQTFISETMHPKQWAAWQAYYRSKGGLGTPTNQNGGWYFLSEWPPGYEEASDVSVAAVAVPDEAEEATKVDDVYDDHMPSEPQPPGSDFGRGEKRKQVFGLASPSS
jgi:hypothetical protein